MPMLVTDMSEIIKDKVLDLLEEHKYSELRGQLEELNAADLAQIFSDIPENILPVVFRLLPKDLASEAFVMMDSDQQEELIHAFSDLELRDVLSQLFVDDAVDLIEEMPAAVVKRILKNTSRKKREVINEVLNYPKNSAGSLMTVECVDLKKEMTVKEAFDRIRLDGVNKETIYTCYVTEQGRVLVGIVTARLLMIASPEETIENLMEMNIVSCKTTDSAEDAAFLIEKYDLIALPVVDAEGRLVGIVTFDDAMDFIREKNDDDIMKMAAVIPAEETYLKTSVFAHAKNRIVWLLILMLSATATGMIITEFENAMTALLVSFIPMLMGTGGNSGSQSTAIIIRGLATNEIRLSDFRRVLFKEIGVAFIVGCALAVANAARLWLLDVLYYHTPGGMVKEMMIVGIALVGAVVLAKALGCILPMMAKKFKLDPALVASPILTTLVDAGTVLLYFNIAVMFG